MRYLKLGLLVVVLSVALAGSLVAVSEQARKAQPVSPTEGTPCSTTEGAGSGGCGGGCGGERAGAGCSAQQLVEEAKKQLEAAKAPPCPRADKGEECDPRTCDDCPRAATTARAAEKTPGADPRHATGAKPAKAAAPAEKMAAKTHECKGKDCEDCEEDCPHKTAAVGKAVAGKPLPRADHH